MPQENIAQPQGFGRGVIINLFKHEQFSVQNAKYSRIETSTANRKRGARNVPVMSDIGLSQLYIVPNTIREFDHWIEK